MKNVILKILGVTWASMYFMLWDVVVIGNLDAQGTRGVVLEFIGDYSYFFVLPNLFTVITLVFFTKWLLDFRYHKNMNRFLGYVAIGNIVISFVMFVIVCIAIR